MTPSLELELDPLDDEVLFGLEPDFDEPLPLDPDDFRDEVPDFFTAMSSSLMDPFACEESASTGKMNDEFPRPRRSRAPSQARRDTSGGRFGNVTGEVKVSPLDSEIPSS